MRRIINKKLCTSTYDNEDLGHHLKYIKMLGHAGGNRMSMGGQLWVIAMAAAEEHERKRKGLPVPEYNFKQAPAGVLLRKIRIWWKRGYWP